MKLRVAAPFVAVAIAACGLDSGGVSPGLDAGDDAGADVRGDAVGADVRADAIGGDAGLDGHGEDAATPNDSGPDAPVITPYACTPASTPAVFVGELAPPLTLAPWQDATPTVTFANCSGSTWTKVAVDAPNGWKLGFDAPRDADTWGEGRIALPADVPSGAAVTIAVPVHAPPLTGPHAYAWGIVHEGSTWLAPSSPQHVIDVEATANVVTLCGATTVDIGGAADATPALQACIDATASGGTLDLPTGIYRMAGAIQIVKPITLRSLGVAPSDPNCLAPAGPRCAVLRADASLLVPRGFLYIGTTTGVAIDHVILDGNRAARLSSAAAQQCAGGNNGPGFNAHADDCSGCKINGGASARALCGTGFEWTGDNLTLTGNVILDNGDHATNNMWSDGFTMLRSNGAIATANFFKDNSDVDLIIGGATNAVIQNNAIVQRQQASFAGLMLDNFNGGTPGDFTGTLVSSNTIDCSAQLCDFAIELGPHPWYLSSNIFGATVSGNTATGGKFNINVEGGGTLASPLVVTQNVVGAAPASATFNCGARPSGSFNVSPDSYVDLKNGPAPTNAMAFHVCP